MQKAVLADQLPDYSGDRCDWLIGAKALAEGIFLVTRDERRRACKYQDDLVSAEEKPQDLRHAVLSELPSETVGSQAGTPNRNLT